MVGNPHDALRPDPAGAREPLSMEHRNDADRKPDKRRLENIPDPDPLLTPEEVCQALGGISKWTFYRRVRPNVPVVKISRKLVAVRLSAVEAYKESLTERPNGQA
jgi:predicted DNA-binding transcriptional regulator AlpA